MAAAKLLVFTCIVLTFLACGIKGPPLPPLGEESIQKQLAAESQSAASSADSTKAVDREKSKK